jgi:hypothetical protein
MFTSDICSRDAPVGTSSTPNTISLHYNSACRKRAGIRPSEPGLQVEIWVTLLYAPQHIAAGFCSLPDIKKAYRIKELAMNPLDSIKGTLIAGLVLAFVLVFVIKTLSGA